jgi:Acyl transferase domain
MALAILCSGQGRQHPDMFALTGDAPEAGGLFGQAAGLLGGKDPRDFVRNEVIEALHCNRTGQILCTLQSLAAAAALRDAMPDRIIVAGYSVGEVAAWGVGGLLDAVDTLDLVASRAEVMDAATRPGDGLMFVRGLSRVTIDRLCQRHDTAVAIVNPGDAYVLGGNRTALREIAAEAEAMRASRVVDLPVEVASHTKRLAAASAAFRERLRSLSPTISSTRWNAHPERRGWRYRQLHEGRCRQAGRADFTNGAMGELPAKLHRSRRHDLPGTRPRARAERDGGFRVEGCSDAIPGRFPKPGGRSQLARASRRYLTGTRNSFSSQVGGSIASPERNGAVRRGGRGRPRAGSHAREGEAGAESWWSQSLTSAASQIGPSQYFVMSWSFSIRMIGLWPLRIRPPGGQASRSCWRSASAPAFHR